MRPRSCALDRGRTAAPPRRACAGARRTRAPAHGLPTRRIRRHRGVSLHPRMHPSAPHTEPVRSQRGPHLPVPPRRLCVTWRVDGGDGLGRRRDVQRWTRRRRWLAGLQHPVEPRTRQPEPPAHLRHARGPGLRLPRRHRDLAGFVGRGGSVAARSGVSASRGERVPQVRALALPSQLTRGAPVASLERLADACERIGAPPLDRLRAHGQAGGQGKTDVGVFLCSRAVEKRRPTSVARVCTWVATLSTPTSSTPHARRNSDVICPML